MSDTLKSCIVIDVRRCTSTKQMVFFVEVLDKDGATCVVWDGAGYDTSYDAAIIVAHEFEQDGCGPVIDRVVT